MGYLFPILRSELLARLRPPVGLLVRTQALFWLVLQYPGKKGNVYSLLWALVFGFATLNILALVTRRFDPHRNRLSFGEMLAILTVVVSIFMLAWELLYLFHILPIKLHAS